MEDNTTVVKTVTNQTFPNTNIQQEVVSTTSNSNQNLILRLDQIIWFIISIIELIIGARFLLLLFGAKNTEFVSIIYSFSKIFILPFTGIFTSPTFNGSYFDTASLIGLIFWLIAGFVITSLIQLFLKNPTE